RIGGWGQYAEVKVTEALDTRNGVGGGCAGGVPGARADVGIAGRGLGGGGESYVHCSWQLPRKSPLLKSALGAASKCGHWRSIDLADLKRMGLLKPIVGDRIKAITWKRADGWLDKLGIIPSARGIQFVKRDDQGKLAGLFVAYTCTPSMFGGCRKWFACPGCRRPARILYGVNSLRCRRCRGLKYASQSEAWHWRAQRHALSIRHRLGTSGDALDGPFPPK